MRLPNMVDDILRMRRVAGNATLALETVCTLLPAYASEPEAGDTLPTTRDGMIVSREEMDKDLALIYGDVGSAIRDLATERRGGDDGRLDV
jgi:hypothetical protein